MEDSGSLCSWRLESFTIVEEEIEAEGLAGEAERGEEEMGAVITEESTIMELRMRELLGGVGRERNTDSVYCVY
jgi:hypothetical protein